jgi:hypothetical protein
MCATTGAAARSIASPRPDFIRPLSPGAGPFGLIIANILARPLMRMAPDIKRHLAPGGSVILSGILASQRWQVLAAFNGQGMRHEKTLWRNGWVTIHLRLSGPLEKTPRNNGACPSHTTKTAPEGAV